MLLLQTLFLGEGEDDDYIVSDLFGKDFAYNKFGVTDFVTAGSNPSNSQISDASMQRSSMHMSASRRFLKEGAVPFYVPVARLSGLV